MRRAFFNFLCNWLGWPKVSEPFEFPQEFENGYVLLQWRGGSLWRIA